MKLRRIAFAAAVLCAAGASHAAPLPECDPDMQAPYPRLRFADGSTTLNDRCPVRKSKLNRKLAPVFVNGRAIGFC